MHRIIEFKSAVPLGQHLESDFSQFPNLCEEKKEFWVIKIDIFDYSSSTNKLTNSFCCICMGFEALSRLP